MKVFKFGGASVKDSLGINNLSSIVLQEKEELVIVVSALGKTTNSLEEVLRMWLDNNKEYIKCLDDLYGIHLSIIDDLSLSASRAKEKLDVSLEYLKEYMVSKKKGSYDYEYDQIVSLGEIWSTTIIGEYLNKSGIETEWIDARKVIITDDNYRDANILWQESSLRVKSVFDFSKNRVFLTQGFIGGTLSGESTTLGREGSDFTAAVVANVLDAGRIVFWKDVQGLLNADPKWIPEAEKLDELSYLEAVEMTFAGAKVIHPKTIKPLQNKNIPLFVKSFLDPDGKGTLVTAVPILGRIIPIFIKKENQILISISPKDFSFAIGVNLGKIFQLFHIYRIKVNLVQASAVSINVCADDERARIDTMCADLREEFDIHFNDNVEMITIRHYTQTAIDMITEEKEILLEQKTRSTVRFVIR